MAVNTRLPVLMEESDLEGAARVSYLSSGIFMSCEM